VSAPSYGIEIEPTEIIRLDSMTREFHLTGITWDSSAPCLRFETTHEEATVTADGVLLYERDIPEDLYGHTTGCAYDFVSIPEGTKEIVVTIKACYENLADLDHYFYRGTGSAMMLSLLRSSLLSGLISFLNVSLGFVMFIYWVVVHKRTQLGNAILYLGIFAILLGTWSALETDFAQVVLQNRVASSFTIFECLLLMAVPFILFFHDYLQDDNPYLCPIFCSLSLILIITSTALHFARVCDLRDLLKFIHGMLGLGMLYFFITLIRTILKKKHLRQIKVSIFGMVILVVSFAADMIAYYNHTTDADSIGRIGFFIFIFSLGIDASGASLHELEEGRKAMIYKELAEKDMLTRCYNRNAYHNDTLPGTIRDGLLLVTFDLNNLKYYNDTFGHACGDQYLIDSVGIMQKVFEPYGKLYRIGGDEFCVLIQPDVPCDMVQLLEDFNKAENDYNEHSETIHLQVACGFAYYKAEHDVDLEETRERADILMYENKRALKGCEPR
jgi:diguanylate cyclase (GGDEF)-like protein